MTSKTDSEERENGSKDRFPANREVDKEAQRLAERYELPRPPGKKITFDQMQEYFKLLTPEMWSHVAIYVYRLKPRIIRQLKDPALPNYIDCLSEPISTDYMIDRHGGGYYMLEVINSDATFKDNGRRQNLLFHCFTEIDQVRYPPKVDYAELDINHKDNMSYIAMLQHKGVLGPDGKPIPQAQQQQTQNPMGVNTEFLKEILGFVKTMTTDQQLQVKEAMAGAEKQKGGLTDAVGNILVEQMRSNDPNRHIEATSQLVDKILSRESKQDNTPLTEFLKLQVEERKANVEAQAKQRETDLQYMKLILDSQNRSATQNSDFGQFQQMFGFCKDILSLGKGNSGDRNGWDIGLDYIKELGGPGLQILNNYLMSRRGAAMPAGVPGAQPGPVAFDPYSNPEALRAWSQQQQQQRMQPQPAQGPSIAPGGIPDILLLVRTYGALVVHALNSGTTGYDFGEYTAGIVGHMAYVAIASTGEDNILKAMLTVPELQMFGEARLRTWVHEFCHFEEIMAKMDGDMGESVEETVDAATA